MLEVKEEALGELGDRMCRAPGPQSGLSFYSEDSCSQERFGVEKGQDLTQIFTDALWPLCREQEE